MQSQSKKLGVCPEKLVFDGFLIEITCESSSVGRARPCQGRGRGFEPRLSLQRMPSPYVREGIFLEFGCYHNRIDNAQVVELVDTQDLKSCVHCGRIGSSPIPGTKSDFSSNFEKFDFFIFSKSFDISAM